MFVNRLLVTIAFTALIVSIIDTRSQANALQNVIKEENNMPAPNRNRNTQEETGKNNIKSSNNDLSKTAYSNKEVVFGEEDNDEENKNANIIMSNSPLLPQHLSLESEKRNSKIEEQDEIADLEELIKQNLNRKQRIDHFHKDHSKHESKLKQFHSQKQLQQKLLNEQDSNYDFDYDLMMLNQLLAMSNNNNNNENINEEDIGDLIQEEETNMRANEIGSNSKKNSNPVKIVEVKEKLIAEDDYNNKAKLTENPFFNTDIFNDFKLKIENDDQANSNMAAAEIPALAMKQNNLHSDSNINQKIEQIRKQNDYLFIFVLAGCTIAGVIALVAAGVCLYTVNRNTRIVTTANVEYGGKKLSPAYNSVSTAAGPGSGSIKSKLSSSSGDRRLAQSAQMYHYQHQKQQMIAMEKANNDTKPDNSDNSEGETEEGDYTVYECPGLAPTGEMEVKNPLYKDDFASSHSIAGSLPPAYSTLSTSKVASAPLSNDTAKTTDTTPTQLIQLEPSSSSTAVDSTTTTAAADTVLIPINETK